MRPTAAVDIGQSERALYSQCALSTCRLKRFGEQPQQQRLAGAPLQRLSVVAESQAAGASEQSPMLFPKWLDPSIAAAAVASLRNMTEVMVQDLAHRATVRAVSHFAGSGFCVCSGHCDMNFKPNPFPVRTPPQPQPQPSPNCSNVERMCAGNRRCRSSRRCCIPPAALRSRGRPGPRQTSGRDTRSSMRAPAMNQVCRKCHVVRVSKGRGEGGGA